MELPAIPITSNAKGQMQTAKVPRISYAGMALEGSVNRLVGQIVQEQTGW